MTWPDLDNNQIVEPFGNQIRRPVSTKGSRKGAWPIIESWRNDVDANKPPHAYKGRLFWLALCEVVTDGEVSANRAQTWRRSLPSARQILSGCVPWSETDPRMKNSSPPTVTEAEFRDDPGQAMQVSQTRPVVLVDEDGERLGLLGKPRLIRIEDDPQAEGPAPESRTTQEEAETAHDVPQADGTAPAPRTAHPPKPATEPPEVTLPPVEQEETAPDTNDAEPVSSCREYLGGLAAAHANEPEDASRARTLRLGSHDMPAIMGLDGNRSALEVGLEKRGGPEAAEILPDNAWFQRGREVEILALSRYAAAHPDGALRRGVTYIAPCGWATATPDMLHCVQHTSDEGLDYSEWRVVEVKSGEPWREPDEDGCLVPAKVRCQVHWQHEVCRRSGLPMDMTAVVIRYAVSGWLAGNDSHCIEYEIPIDPAYCEELWRAACQFWRRMKAGEMPEADGSDSARKALARQHPEPNGEYIRATHLDEKRFALHVHAKAERDRFDDLAQRAGNAIRQSIGAHDGMTSPLWNKPAKLTVNRKTGARSLLTKGVL